MKKSKRNASRRSRRVKTNFSWLIKLKAKYSKYQLVLHLIIILLLTLFFSQGLLKPGYEPIIRNDLTWHFSMVNYFHSNFNGHYDFWWDSQGAGAPFFLYTYVVPWIIPSVISLFTGVGILLAFKISCILGLFLLYVAVYYLVIKLTNKKGLALLSSILFIIIGYKDIYSTAGITNLFGPGNYTFLYGAAFAIFFFAHFFSEPYNNKNFALSVIFGALSILSNPLPSSFAFMFAVVSIIFLKKRILRFASLVFVFLISSFWVFPFMAAKVHSWNSLGKGTAILIDLVKGQLFNNYFFTAFCLIGLVAFYFMYKKNRFLVLSIPVYIIIAAGWIARLPINKLPLPTNFQWYRASVFLYLFAAFFIAFFIYYSILLIAKKTRGYAKYIVIIVIACLCLFLIISEYNGLYNQTVKKEYLNSQQIQHYLQFAADNVRVSRIAVDNQDIYYHQYGNSANNLYNLVPVVTNSSVYSYYPAAQVPFWTDTDYMVSRSRLNNSYMLSVRGIGAVLTVDSILAKSLVKNENYYLINQSGEISLFGLKNASGTFYSTGLYNVTKINANKYCFSVPNNNTEIHARIDYFPNWRLSDGGFISKDDKGFMMFTVNNGVCLEYKPKISIYWIISFMSTVIFILTIIYYNKLPLKLKCGHETKKARKEN